MKRSIRVFMAIAALACSTGVFASGALPEGPYVIAPGIATTDVAPDYVVFTFTLEGVAPKTVEASAIVDQKAEKLFVILKADGIAQDDIRASTLNAAPAYDYDDKTNKRIYKGQELSREFKITLHDLSKFPNFIQDLLDDNIDVADVDFESSRKAEVDKRNLEAAIDDARKRAEDMAAQAGEHVDRVYGMAPGEYSSYITRDFPFQGQYGGISGLGKIEVTGSRIKRTDTYVIPKWITFTSNVTIICTVK